MPLPEALLALFLAWSLPLPAMAGGLYDTARADLPDWLRDHNYLAAPSSPAHPAPVMVINRSGAPLLCQITLAHWYVIRTGPLAPDAQMALPFRFEPESGTVSWLNETHQEMAVEGLACGTAPALDAAPTGLPFHRIVREGARLICARTGCEITQPR